MTLVLFVLMFSMQACQAYEKDRKFVDYYENITILDANESPQLSLQLYTFPYITDVSVF